MSDKLVDFVAKRNKAIENKKRSFERILLSNFLGCYSVIESNGAIYPVQMVDISHDGCMIQVPTNKNNDEQFKVDTEITLRVYFTQDSFIPVVVKIKYGQDHIEKQATYVRYGCQFDKSNASFAALKPFIDFIYKFAELSVLDKGDAKVYFL